MLISVSYTETQFSALKSELKELQHRPKAARASSKRALVELLAGELLRGRKLGYSLKELAELVGKHGVEIRPDLLGQYLRASSKESTSEKPVARSLTTSKVPRRSEDKSADTKASSTSPEAEAPTKVVVKTAETPQVSNEKREGIKGTFVGKNIETGSSGITDRSGKTDTNATPQGLQRGKAVSSGGFTPRPDTDDI